MKNANVRFSEGRRPRRPDNFLRVLVFANFALFVALLAFWLGRGGGTPAPEGAETETPAQQPPAQAPVANPDPLVLVAPLADQRAPIARAELEVLLAAGLVGLHPDADAEADFFLTCACSRA